MYKTTTRLHGMAFYNMEDRRKKIIEYVNANSKCTKTEVIKDMEKKGIGSIKTIHPIIIDLLNEGILLVLKNRPNSQIHRLIINNENEFNKIYNCLTDLESLISKMDKNASIMRHNQEHFDEHGDVYIDDPHTAEPGLIREFEKLKAYFIDAYHEATDTILRKLLYRVKEKIHNEKDSQILYMKILELLNKLSTQFSNLNIDRLNQITNDKLRRVKPSEYSVRLGVNTNIVKDIIATIENFKNQFLSRT